MILNYHTFYMNLISQILTEAIYHQDLVSSNLDSVWYNTKTEKLRVKFLSGGIYQYTDVPEEIYEELINATSHGSFFYYNIAYSFPYKRIRKGKKIKKLNSKKR